MAGINVGRVVLGGLLAGLVMNIGEFVLNVPILGADWMATMESLNRPVSDSAMYGWVAWGFLIGIAMVWVYACIRPRFGAGPKTAVIAGLTVWLLTYVLAFAATSVITGLYPTKIVITSVIWGLFELPIATVAGAWLYKEGAAAPAAAAAQF